MMTSDKSNLSIPSLTHSKFEIKFNTFKTEKKCYDMNIRGLAITDGRWPKFGTKLRLLLAICGKARPLCRHRRNGTTTATTKREGKRNANVRARTIIARCYAFMAGL